MRKIKSTAQLSVVLGLVKQLHIMGYGFSEIARQLHDRLGLQVSPSTAMYYLNKINVEFKNTPLPDARYITNREIAVLQEVRRQAFEALEQSKQEYVKQLNETSTTQVGEYEQTRTREQITREHRLASADYMRVILDTDKQLRELLGLDAAIQVEVLQKVQVSQKDQPPPINFDDLYQRSPIIDPAEERIRALQPAQPELITDDEKEHANGVLRPNGES